MQNPRNLATLLDSTDVRPYDWIDNWLRMPPYSFDERDARATGLFELDVSSYRLEILVYNESMGVGHFHESGISRGSETSG